MGLLLCWLTCKSSSFVMLSATVQADFHYSSFVHTFINSFSIGLTNKLLEVIMKQILMIFLTVLIATGCATSQTTVPLWKTLPEVPPMPQADESGLAPVNDIKMYYAIFNKDGKEPVILLHGGLVSSDEWGFEVPLLSKTHKVIIVDSRGHGRSTMSDKPFGYNLMASDVLQLMDLPENQKGINSRLERWRYYRIDPGH
jgi:hypothetical protein